MLSLTLCAIHIYLNKFEKFNKHFGITKNITKNTEIQIISRKIKLFFERVIFFELAPKNKNEIVHMYVEVLNV